MAVTCPDSHCLYQTRRSCGCQQCLWYLTLSVGKSQENKTHTVGPPPPVPLADPSVGGVDADGEMGGSDRAGLRRCPHAGGLAFC